MRAHSDVLKAYAPKAYAPIFFNQNRMAPLLPSKEVECER